MFRCYRQLEHADCGITCLRMIARYYGRKIPVNYLKESCDLSRLGMSVKDISDCAGKVGLESAIVRIGKTHIPSLPLPAILYWQQKHFVVLYKINKARKKYKIADPAIGKVTCKEDDFVKFWM